MYNKLNINHSNIKKNFKITKIGNSLFATLSKDVVKNLKINPGDNVLYEIVPGKRKLIMNIIPKSKDKQTNLPDFNLSPEDKKWIEDNAGSLSLN